DHTVLVSRVNTKIKYSTKFLFVSAMNPCPCGNLLAKSKECSVISNKPCYFPIKYATNKKVS
ncbi:MAG: hypothetical protein DRG78_03605, partial [Epsilonproteobacteria bacterium]